MLGVFVMSCCRKIEPEPMFTRQRLPGKICPGVKITAQLLNDVTVTIVTSVRKIENGLTNGLTITTGLGLTTPKYLKRQSSHAAARGIQERTMNARRRDFMWGASLNARTVSASMASFIPLHTVVNANLVAIDDHNFDRRPMLRK